MKCKSDNAIARSFWIRYGFNEQSRQDNLITMSRDLSSAGSKLQYTLNKVHKELKE